MVSITNAEKEPHITPLQDSMWHRGMAGAESCVFNFFENFAAEVSSNNSIKIRSGIGMIQGRFFCIEPSTYDEVTITNGTQGEKRIDLIVCRWTVNEEQKIQGGDWVVIQGTPTTGTPAAPSYTDGNLDAGDLIADMPCYEVTLDGINVTGVDRRFAILEGMTKVRPISAGGTGASTAEGAKKNLGIEHTGAAASARGSQNVTAAAGTITNVPLDTWIARTDAQFDFSSGGIKCPYTGVIEISGSVYLTSSSGSHGCYVVCGQNETSQYIAASTGGAVASGSIIVPVNAGDIVSLKGRGSVAGNIAGNNAATHLDVKYIR